MRIIFFGASVTAQTGEASYVECLKPRLEGVEVEKVGYGACHLDDAGFYKLGEVICRKPAVCILEWCTTGLSEYSEAKLQSILYELLSNNIKVAFLILPRKDTNLQRNRAAEEQILNMAKRRNIPLLDMRPVVDAELCLRDNVHTNSSGALEYAKHISRWVGSWDFRFLDGSGLQLAGSRSCFVVERLLTAEEELELVCDVASSGLRELAVEITVGPNLLDLKLSSATHKIEETRSFVDPWCYYERRMFYPLLNLPNSEPGRILRLTLRALASPLPVFTQLRGEIDLRKFGGGVKGIYLHQIHGAGISTLV